MEIKELIQELTNLKTRINKAEEVLDRQRLEEELENLQKQSNLSSFWQDKNKAAETLERISSIKEFLSRWHNFNKECQELIDLTHMVAEEKDENVFSEIVKRKTDLIKKFEQEEIKVLMAEKYDENNVLLSVHAGTGGVEAQDWAEMLLRMYQRYGERVKFKLRVLDITKEEAGIKSATLEIKGPYAFGYLKGEAGVHRLVRISPFDAEKLRQTSFALVEVIPEIKETEDIEIKDDEIKIETFRSSGPGGQHAQKTESAVRITHLPTGLSASCQNERSQYQNKLTALKILKSKIIRLEIKKDKGEIAKIKSDVMASWGRQIRSYVLHPYQMVKDHRTNFETSDTQGVLNGGIDEFIEAYLRKVKK